MKRLSLLLFCLLSMVSWSLAQRTVTGTVVDKIGESLIGANVLVKGTSSGTITDLDGSFSIEVPDGSNRLVISFTGYESQEFDITGQTSISVTLEEGELLEEIVVTGLGIKKERKALGYGVTTLGGDDLQLRPEADVGRVLRGKVPGVNISSTSGLAGSGTNIIIRGYSSITGNNQPLFVVDGVPFNSDTNSDRGFTQGGATASSRFLDLDPNNISEISILKGLSATVLYGEAGRNGVVLVTTKGGSGVKSSKKTEITYNQSYFQTKAASIPDDQDQYGNGWQNFAAAAFSNWGAPFDQPNNNGIEDGTIAHPYDRAALNDVFPEYVGARYAYKDYDNLQQFFQKGNSVNSSININSNLGKNTSLNFNYGYLNDQGFTPKRADGSSSNDFKKHNFGMGLNTQLENGLRVSATFNYTNSGRNSPPATPIFSSNPFGGGASLFSNVLYTPRSVDLFGLEYENPVDHTSIFYRGGNDIQHPLWTLNNINDEEKVTRYFGTTQFLYDLTENLYVSYRLGLDTYTQRTRYTINKGGRQVPDGLLNTAERLNSLQDHQMNVGFDFDLSNDFSFNGVVGFNIKKENRDYTITNSTQQFIYGLHTHQNYSSHNNFSFDRDELTLGALFSTTLGYKDYLYVNIQGRNDWTSTLEAANRSFFYPSASVAFIATDAVPSLTDGGVLNHLKFRFGYGSSAGYPDPYQTRNTLSTSTNVFVPSGGTAINTNSVSNNLGNVDLKPEQHKEFELGIESKLWNNKLGFEVSLYHKKSTDLIIALPLDPSTGFTSTTINAAAMTNKGVEIGVNFRPVVSSSFSWDIGSNFTANSSIVDALSAGIEQAQIIDVTESGSRAFVTDLGNYAIPGKAYGVLQGSRIVRDADGNAVISAAGTYQQDPNIGIIGNPNPDYRWNNYTTISFKGLSFRAQLDFTKGGDIWASTPSTLYGRGILEETGQFDRFVPVIVPGVKADGTPNDIQITSNRHFWEHAGVFYDENRIFDGTHLKLREVSLSYDFPSGMIEKTPFGRMSIVLSGQNLWYKSFNIPDGANFDPEVLSTGVGNGQGFDFVTGPTARKIGASLSITF